MNHFPSTRAADNLTFPTEITGARFQLQCAGESLSRGDSSAEIIVETSRFSEFDGDGAKITVLAEVTV
jgi:hypothetical protein